MNTTLASFTDVLVDEICNSQPLSLSSSVESRPSTVNNVCNADVRIIERPPKGTGQRGQFRSTEEINPKYRDVFSYPYFNLVQSSVIDDALYTDKSIVVCAPTGSGKTVVFEMAIVQLLMELEDKQYTDDFKIIYMAPVKALCTERLTEWYPKFTKLGLLCIEVTGDTDVDFTQLKPYKIIITTPEKWDMLTRRWRDHRGLVEVIKLFLIDEVHILNDETRGPVLEAVVSRMKTIENSAQSVHRIEQLQKEIQGQTLSNKSAPRIRFVAVSATVSNPEDVASWLGTSDNPAVFYKFGDECRPVKLKRIVEGYPCAEGTSIFKFDIILNYKLWPIIQKYHSGKPTLIFCNTRKSVELTAETLSRELTISFNAEQKAKLTAVASSIKNKKLQALVMNGVGCHHAGLLYEERQTIELAFRNRDLPILITTTTLAMGVNLPAHLVIVKNTQHYVSGAYQEYSISTVLQMVGRAGRPQFDTEATAVIMTRLVDKPRYQALVGGCEPLQSFLHKRLAENLNSEAALGTVGDVAQCVQWLRSTFLYVRAARDPKKYLGLSQNSPQHLIAKKIEELCVKAMNGLASSGLITMDEVSCIESTEAGRLMSLFYLDLETMKLIMKIEGTESLERLLVLICESHELADMHLRMDERRCLNLLNRNNVAATIRFPMKGKITTRQMKLNCIIQAVLGCLSIPNPSLNQEAMKIMRIADRVCKCLVTYVTRSDLISQQPQFCSAVLNSILLRKCVAAHLWENSPYVSKQLKGIGPTFSTLLASAGKVNFMLLEESHPRDLERIMNKGPPAGNVLRKQVSLLPKYQLTMIPVDEKTVTVQLVLLNQSHLAENMDSLTAGDSHKSYIIVGDSVNNLLLLVAFKDRDLISVFDGTIAHEVRRKHNFEHKIFAHCISSTFVGIDVQSEYSFNDLEPFLRVPTSTTPTNAKPPNKSSERQTCITDTFKERKRKINPYAIEKSKEKRKRENAIIENFKYLKQSFERASKNISQSMNQQSRQNKELSNKNADACSLTDNKISNATNSIETNPIVTDENTCSENINSDDFIDEEKIDSILNEIENEMTKSKTSLNNINTNTNAYFREKSLNGQNPFSTQLTGSGLKNTSSENKITNSRSSNYKTLSALRKNKAKTPKSNYNFIELLERKLSISDEEDKTEVPPKDNGFSDSIKNQIQKYLTKTQTKTSVPDRNIKMLLNKPEAKLPDDDEKANEVKGVDLDCEILNSPTHITYPRYEIKEILGDETCRRQNCYKQPTTGGENLIYSQDSKICDSMTYTNDIVKNSKNIEVETRHCDPDMIITLSLDDKDPRKYSENELKTDNLDDTLIFNIDETSEMLSNLENVNREIDYSNEKDIICVEEYNFNNENIECRNNVVNIDPDVIMISPTEVDSDKNNIEINNQHSVEKEQNIVTKSIVTEGRNNNPSSVVVDNKELQNLCESTISDATGNYLYTDTDIKNRTQIVVNDKASHKKALSIKDVYEPTTVPTQGTTFHDNILAIQDVGSNYYQSAYRDEHLYIPTGKLAMNDHYSVILQNRNQLINIAPHDTILAIENIDSNFNQPTKINASANNNCLDIVQKNSNQVVENTRVSHDKILEIENIGFHHNISPKVHDPLKIPGLDIVLESRNKKEINNKKLHEKTLATEDSGPNMHPDQAQHNNRISFMNHNEISNPSKNLTGNKRNHDFVKRYVYSTSKVDVCTKQAPEYCVHVIKKVKMDLDITAIVSRKQNSSQNYETDAEETSSSNKKMKIDELPKQDDAGEESNKIIATVRNEMINTSKVNLPASRTPRPEFPMDNSVIMEPDKEKGEKSESNILKSVNENNPCESLINENQTKYDNKQIPEVRQEELKGQDNRKYNYEKTSEKLIRELETGDSPAKGENNIKNILHKYSKILAKNAVKAATPSCSGINRTVIGNSTSTTKSQKPFKITDINKLHAALPETIVDNKPQVEKDIRQLPIVNRYVESKKKREELLNSNQYTDCTETAPIEEIPEYESITDLDLEPIHLPANDDLEPSRDYKIDQSMFDPKTLLQTVADDDSDEIVPPPPEFCDGITYSPNYENGETSMADEYDKVKTPQNYFFTDNYMEYNDSIFDDCSATNLTPSTEIETWNLSQEDSWEPRNAINLSPVKSFTVMRRNTNTDCFSQNTNLSRQARLGSFRLNQKSKLKIRK